MARRTTLLQSLETKEAIRNGSFGDATHEYTQHEKGLDVESRKCEGIDLCPSCHPPWLARNFHHRSCRLVSLPPTSPAQRSRPRTLPAGFHPEPGGRGAARDRTRIEGADSLGFRPDVAAGQRLETTMRPARLRRGEGLSCSCCGFYVLRTTFASRLHSVSK